jgi:hypothetical protein
MVLISADCVSGYRASTIAEQLPHQSGIAIAHRPADATLIHLFWKQILADHTWSAGWSANNRNAVSARFPVKVTTPTGPTQNQMVQVIIPFSVARSILLIQSVRIAWSSTRIKYSKVHVLLRERDDQPPSREPNRVRPRERVVILLAATMATGGFPPLA